MKKITAIFKGQNGSMGFHTNQQYELLMDNHCNGWLTIFNNKGVGWCIYGSFIAFLNNWDEIKIQETY